MDTPNDYNYVRVSRLEPISIESFALVIVGIYLLYLIYNKKINWDIAYFLALPFTDDPFRIGPLQPVEILAMILIIRNYRNIRLSYVILIGLTFLLYSAIGFITNNVHGSYSPLYSVRFLLLGLVFSIFSHRKFCLQVSTIRFLVVLSFAVTLLQAGLWTAGLPVHGIFYNGILPRTKGLAHEPATWAIWVVTLFPFILHFKLGRRYLAMNFIMLLFTFSTFGTIVTGTFFLIRWILSGGRFRLRKSVMRFIGATILTLIVTIIIKPDMVNSAAKLLTVFDKFSSYQQELAAASQGQSTLGNDVGSGRGSDFLYFQTTFPSHWLVGVGSFNAPYDVTQPNPIAGTNTYVVLPVEMGLTGALIIFFLLLQHYRVLCSNRRMKSIDFMAYSLNFLLMISGIRCFGFYEPWYAQATLLRLAKQADLESTEAHVLQPIEPATV